jgi:hypothetical protein
MSVVNWATKSRWFNCRGEHVPLLLEGVGDGFVVGEDDEVARFQHMAEMLYDLVDDQVLAIVGAVLLLGRVEFFGEGEGLPGFLEALLEHGTHGGRGKICDECNWRGWIGVRQ